MAFFLGEALVPEIAVTYAPRPQRKDMKTSARAPSNARSVAQPSSNARVLRGSPKKGQRSGRRESSHAV